ncbi:tyrosine-type recombinase/integrase [Actinomadura sp. 3N508]|uniref:tyrosine-type recombinase/integrase n=1 Tax=Actinomadura sp. 3N508 TaxID=3375153 RepID=UPI003788CFC8
MRPLPPPERLAWWRLRFEHTQAIRAALREETTPKGERWSPAYVNQHLVALRCVLRFSRRHQLMTADDFEAAADVAPVRGHREQTGRAVGEDEIDKILRACLTDDDNPARGIRDAALIALMHATGIRREEAVQALRAHYDAALRTLRIVGKGNKERTVYVHRRAAEWINAWLALLPAKPGPLFRPVHWSGNVQARALKPSSVNYIITVRCAEARVAVFTPHDLRRTFISGYLAVGGDIVLAQRQAGHASVATTAGYDRRSDAVLQETVELLYLPTPADVHALAA